MFFLSLIATPSIGAERIYVSYSLLERSVPVKDLEIYAKEGRLSSELRPYARYLSSAQLQQLRTSLQAPIALDPLTISQFLYSGIGERLLRRVSQVVETKSGQPGFYALRAALVLAAADPEGLTALSVLRHFPTQGVKVDLGEGLEILGQVQQLVQQTNGAVAAIEQQAQAAQQTAPDVNFFQLRDLRERGPLGWEKTTLQLSDANRPLLFPQDIAPRTFPVDIYLPTARQSQPQPVVVISHGLNSDRSSFAYLAEHLASYGFVVAVPEHLGSNTQQFLNLVKGQAKEVAKPSEFVNRPLDIKFLLDELAKRNASDNIAAGPSLRGRLNLNQVGVIGQSFGGYTALAIAGASINFNQLRQDCGAQLDDTLNLSLLLQCQAIKLPAQDYNLGDPRVKAVIAINPVDSSILGQENLSQIKLPVMLIAGSADTIAPALPEQIQPFTWLTAPQKYLVLIKNGTHLSTIDQLTNETGVLPTIPVLVGQDTALARNYLRALSVAFLKTHVANQKNYAVYLNANYAAAIGREPLPLSLIQNYSRP